MIHVPDHLSQFCDSTLVKATVICKVSHYYWLLTSLSFYNLSSPFTTPRCIFIAAEVICIKIETDQKAIVYINFKSFSFHYNKIKIFTRNSKLISNHSPPHSRAQTPALATLLLSCYVGTLPTALIIRGH